MGEPEGLDILHTFDFGSIEEMDPSVGGFAYGLRCTATVTEVVACMWMDH